MSLMRNDSGNWHILTDLNRLMLFSLLFNPLMTSVAIWVQL